VVVSGRTSVVSGITVGTLEADEATRGRYIVFEELAAAWGLFEMPDVLGTSSCVLTAK
jgi:hypothetical protein